MVRFRIVAAICAVVLVCVAPPALARRHADPVDDLPRVHLGKIPPDITLALLTGAERLTALEDRPVVLNFFATYCEPCTDEMPYFARAMQAYGDTVRFVVVSNEPSGDARTWLREHGYGVPVAEDPNDVVWRAWSMEPIPVTVVVAPSGKIAALRIGGLNYEQLQAAIDAARLP
jgi:thiol-disulfide isomerase/thioredoxin